MHLNRPAVSEQLESRMLLAADLVGREYFGVIRFDVPVPAGRLSSMIDRFYDLSSPATLVAQMSQFKPPNVALYEPNLELFTATNRLISDNPGTANEQITTSAPAGNVQVTVGTNVPALSQSFVLAVAADRAPGNLVSGSQTDFRADRGRNLGKLSAASTKQVTDFVGFLDGNSGSAADFIDTYFFDIPQSGSVRMRVDALQTDLAGSSLRVFTNVRLFRDFDNDGKLEPTELLRSATAIPGGDVSKNTALSAGRYAVVVSSFDDLGNIGGTNYRLRLNYTVADAAGNSLATARDIGQLGNTAVSFQDYLASNDADDFYKFTTVAGQGGPFTFDANLLVNSSNGADFDLSFIRDANNNGAVDAGETIFTGDNRGTSGESFLVAFAAPGTYFIKANRISGEGPYTLNAKNTNTDRGGNTLAAALNIARLFGRKTLSDSISSTDTLDVIKFTVEKQGIFRANVAQLANGQDANLDLVRDINGDGQVQAGDVVASSSNTSNAAESIFANLAPADYFVRVLRIAGTPTYQLTMTIDTAGESAATALSLPPTGAAAGASEFVGANDTTDFYAVDIASNVQFNTFVQGSFAPVTLEIFKDANNNGSVDSGESIVKKTVGTTLDRTFITATPGRYLVKVARSGTTETNYTIDFRTAPVDNAGNTFAKARNVGVLSTQKSFGDFIGTFTDAALNDDDDFYKFTLGTEGPYSFTATMSVSNVSGTGSPGYELIFDENNNGAIDDGEILVKKTGAPAGAPPPTQTLLNRPGSYFVHVRRFVKSVNFNYSLKIAAQSTDEAANTLAAASDFGTIAPNTTSTIGGFVGAIDPIDLRRFSTSAPGELNLDFTVAGAPDVHAQIIRDANNNGSIDVGDVIATSVEHAEVRDVLNGVVLPVAGAYFVAVANTGVATNYVARFTPVAQAPFGATPVTVTNTAATRIEAENFDKGDAGNDERIAYRDTTNGNTGNNGFRSAENIDVDVKSTTDTGGGLRVTDTDVGEFLEYTIFVSTSGAYDLGVRCSSPDPNAAFHVEIDGANVTGRVDVPDTGAVDAMTTMLTTNVPIASGPHIVRLAIDSITGAGATAFAGAYNFIELTPAALSTGSFALSPAKSVVRAFNETLLNLNWTVPGNAGWRTLTNVRLRLHDNTGTAAVLRFEESTNVLQLLDAATGSVVASGPFGTQTVLSNQYVNVHLANSRVIVAAGSTSPSVSLQLDVRFLNPSRGRRLLIEAAALDDFGHDQDFAAAGIVDILT